METKFKNVLITGASSGIGEAMALYYAASGIVESRQRLGKPLYLRP